MRHTAERAAPAAGRRRRAPGRPGKWRLIDYPRSRKNGVRRWLPSWKQVLGVFVFCFGSLVAAVGYVYATATIPTVNPSTQIQSDVFYWADGSQMASAGQVNRQNVGLSQVPLLVQWDFLAAENSTFYTDPGIDPQGIARAVLNMAKGGAVQSGSTITQQFVKNTYLNQNQSISRKLNEIVISVKIGSRMSKQQILQGYLNTCYFGRGASGVEAAAEAYYHVHASQLTVSQGAFLAAAVNEPSVLMNADSDPKAKALAEARWKYVLDRMVTDGKLSPAQRATYRTLPLPKPYVPASRMTGQTGYLVQTAENYVTSHSSITEQDLSHGGYQVYTTFDKKKVTQLAAAVTKTSSAHLDPKHHAADRNVQFGAASVDPATGAVVALYGGPGWDKGHFTDNADASGVPVGSTFKPIDLAAALQDGAVLSPGQGAQPITLASRFNGDDGIEIKDQKGNYITDSTDPSGLLHQHNDTTHRWGYISLRTAMEQSVNTPYVQLGEDVGYANVENTAINVGLLRSSLQYNTAGFFIGTSTPSAIRMADAYATFAASGTHYDPYSVSKVVSNGETLPGFTKPNPVQALKSSTADTVTNVLQAVIKQGTGTNAQVLGRPAAGKTGTTDNYKSAWFIGYTPQLSTAVVLFKEDPKHPTLQSMTGVGGYTKVFGGVIPTQVWTDYMTAALVGQPTVNFPAAPNLGTGANEYGAPAPSPSTPPTPTATPSPTATTSTPVCHPARRCGPTTQPTPSGGLPSFPGGSPAPTASPTRKHGHK
jgi:membrane peptidoglycan carboxypeptidase